ncbi:MAG: type II secretion system F family protein [Bryobacterales bacterium]|nr:type II secretion system F family protein [Bryobacterales bacterium]
MVFLFSLLLFVLLAAVFASLGLNVWARPRAAIDRITGNEVELEQAAIRHPSLVFHDLIDRLGSLLPASPKEATVVERRLMRAGFRKPGAIKLLYGSKVLLALLAPLAAAGAVAASEADPANKIMMLVGATAVGFFAPNEYLRMAAKRRQKQIRRGLPNALDLLVVCVESGLGLDQAVVQVAKELESAHPEISEEFALMNLEMKAGKRRAEALRNLGERTSVEELKKLTAVLIQADKFGTSVAQSLRAHSDYMRVQRRQEAEEKAAKLGVKLVFPIFFCILPSLFVVTVGPMFVRIIRDLLPMINNM